MAERGETLTLPRMLPFTYVSSPGRVLFGSGGTRELAAELERLGCRRAFVVCTPDQKELALRVAAECGVRAISPGARPFHDVGAELRNPRNPFVSG
jgi:hypothetical protein